MSLGGINLFPKAVFLVVLLTYLKATEEFKATHHHPEEQTADGTESRGGSFKARFKERFRRQSQTQAV